MREMTKREAAWWKDFKAVLRRLPKNVELNARVGGEIGISPAGARSANFEIHLDADSFSDDEWECVRVPRLDGRDSHL